MAADGSDDRCQRNAVPTVLFMLYPERSAFNASFTLARRLREKGYRVLYGGPAPFRDHVRAQGFHYELIEPPQAQENDSSLAPGVFARWANLRRLVQWERKVYEEMMDSCERYLRSVNPSLVLLDPLICHYAVAPLRCGVPIIGFSTALAGAFNPAVPPAFCDLQPITPSGWKSRLRHRLAWAKCLAPLRLWVFCADFLWPLGLLLPHQAGVMARIRQQGGRLRWGEYGPRLDVPELVASPPEFDFPQAVATSGRIYAGTCVEASRSDGSFDWSWLVAGMPLLYCSLGTYSHEYPHARRLFDAVLGALQRRPDIQAIVQVGTCAEIDAFGPLPARIRVVKHAPQLEVLERSQIFVTHGGLSSVREAIYFGVPMLVFPCWKDQPGNSARIALHGLGLASDIAEVDAAGVLRMLEGIADPRFSTAMGKMQQVFRQQDDCQAAVDYVVARLERAPELPGAAAMADRQAGRGLPSQAAAPINPPARPAN